MITITLLAIYGGNQTFNRVFGDFKAKISISKAIYTYFIRQSMQRTLYKYAY